MSFIADKIVMDGLTFDDVLLIPAYSEVLPRTVDLTTKFSKNIELKIPFVTAAMDTVTEAKMAIIYIFLFICSVKLFTSSS
jgi:IMP dehydrogenase